MLKEQEIQRILIHAMEQEKEYNWLEAADAYQRVLPLISEQDFSEKAEILERLGYALFRAAMQAENRDEFKEKMSQAIANYEKAKEFFRKSPQPEKTAKKLRCEAMITYIGYWLTADPLEKKKLLDECWRLTNESLKAFENAGAGLEFAKTFNQLSTSARLILFFEWNPQRSEEITREALRHGEQAIRFLTVPKEPHELAKALVRTGILNDFLTDLIERETRVQKTREYITKAKELSEEITVIELSNIFVEPHVGIKGGTEEALSYTQRALEHGRKTKDKVVIGWMLDWLAYNTHWKMWAIEDPDVRTELQNRALQYAEDARLQYYPISFISPRSGVLWTQAPETENYSLQAQFETDPSKRRELLNKAVENAPNLLKQAVNSGYPSLRLHSHHIVSKALASLAQTETNTEEKKKILEKALYHRSATVRLCEQCMPLQYWALGVMYSYLGDIKSELADVATDFDTKKNMLQEATLDKETAVELCFKAAQFFEAKGSLPQFASLGRYQYQYGSLLNRLYEFTHNKEHREKAAEAFKNSAESFQKAGLASRVAECHWKAAQVYDYLGDYAKAAENFSTASTSYQTAAENVKQLKEFYQEHSIYMQAWCQIEKAKHHHLRQQHDLAKECFEEAASMHESLKQWSYLAPNYSAWAHVENAEDLSRKEQSEESIQAFEQATRLFSNTKKSLQMQAAKIENPDEKQMAANILKSTDLRQQYCKARINIEEAKILDRRGDHYSSSEKYGLAVEALERVKQALESEQEIREHSQIISLSRAWQRMTHAEAEASPALYNEAAELFEEAKELCTNEKAKMLTLGHSRFCKALEVGTRFADTRDPATHAAAIQFLNSAANFYLMAGFPKASEYAKATELLFDAYLHVDNAKKESNPEKKAKLYLMAEKVLQTSADSYSKAEHAEKREQVLRLLERVREERELAVSLTEVLHAPSIVSTTTTFATPTLTHEEAVGVEKFEHANIRANILTLKKELRIGENLELEVEIVNTGKGQALLTKVDDIVPKGFELVEKPANYRMEVSGINMRGKRLDPLKTEEVRLVLKPLVKGSFALKPTILYLDEDGRSESHQPEPVAVTVKELGLVGWLKGEK